MVRTPGSLSWPGHCQPSLLRSQPPARPSRTPLCPTHRPPDTPHKAAEAALFAHVAAGPRAGAEACDRAQWVRVRAEHLGASSWFRPLSGAVVGSTGPRGSGRLPLPCPRPHPLRPSLPPQPSTHACAIRPSVCLLTSPCHVPWHPGKGPQASWEEEHGHPGGGSRPQHQPSLRTVACRPLLASGRPSLAAGGLGRRPPAPLASSSPPRFSRSLARSLARGQGPPVHWLVCSFSFPPSPSLSPPFLFYFFCLLFCVPRQPTG